MLQLLGWGSIKGFSELLRQSCFSWHTVRDRRLEESPVVYQLISYQQNQIEPIGRRRQSCCHCQIPYSRNISFTFHHVFAYFNQAVTCLGLNCSAWHRLFFLFWMTWIHFTQLLIRGKRTQHKVLSSVEWSAVLYVDVLSSKLAPVHHTTDYTNNSCPIGQAINLHFIASFFILYLVYCSLLFFLFKSTLTSVCEAWLSCTCASLCSQWPVTDHHCFPMTIHWSPLFPKTNQLLPLFPND